MSVQQRPKRLSREVDSTKQAQGAHSTATFDGPPEDMHPRVDAEHSPRILHIEDDADFSRAVKLRMQQRGIAVLNAFDGTDGFFTAMTEHAHAILLDIEMPNCGGDFILRRLKDNPITRDIPVIVVTSVSCVEMASKLINGGAERVFIKPLDYDQLFHELCQHIPKLTS